jgi:Protein of unknown function (DUF3667)
MSEAAAPLPLCANCGQAFGAPRPAYCPACGQETQIKAPTVGEFLQQFGGAYFSTEGALWRTFKLLLTRPGELTAQYLAGRRKHYVLPLRLFLTISVLMLLSMRVVSSLEYADFEDPEVTNALPDQPFSMQLELGLGSAGLDNGVFYCEGLPAWLCGRIEKRLNVDARAVVLQMQKVSERVASHAGYVSFALLPGFAFGLWLLFRSRGLHYTEHLVFALHLHAFWFLLAAVLMWAGLLIGEYALYAALLGAPAYAALSMHRVYGGRWWALVLRLLVLMLGHIALIVPLVAAVTLAALLL